MLRSEVELVKRLLAQKVDPAHETIEQRLNEIERQLKELQSENGELKKQVNNLKSLPEKGTQRSKEK